MTNGEGKDGLNFDLKHVNVNSILLLLQFLAILVGGSFYVSTFVDQMHEIQEKVAPLVQTVQTLDNRTTKIEVKLDDMKSQMDDVKTQVNNLANRINARIDEKNNGQH